MDPAWPGLADPAAPTATAALDRATAEATPADRAEVVRAFVEGAGGLETAGYVRTDHWHGALASSAGQTARVRRPSAGWPRSPASTGPPVPPTASRD